MYMTRMKLDTSKRKTMLALASPSLFHGAIENAFPGERERKLWRIDKLNGEYSILLLSPEMPDLSNAMEQFGTGTQWETKPYEPLLDRVTDHSVWRFRLTANPVKSIASGKGERGKVCAHITEQYQTEWLTERAPRYGFDVNADNFMVTGSKWYKFEKGVSRHPVTLLAVSYEGLLHVTDADKFKETLINGIGRGKAYGLGLLTIMRAF